MAASPAADTLQGHRRLSVWKVVAKGSIDACKDEIAELQEQDGNLRPDQKKALKLAKQRLVEATTALEPTPGRGARLWARTGGRLVEYWTGSAKEEAWEEIHDADALLTYAAPAAHLRAELPGLRQTVSRRVDDDSYRDDLLQRLKLIEGNLDAQAKKEKEAETKEKEAPLVVSSEGIYFVFASPGGGPPGGPNGSSGAPLTITHADREAIAHAKREIYKSSSRAYEQQRRFRNIILATAFVAALVAIALAALGHFDKTLTYRLDMYPKTGREMYPTTLWPVILIGALAGFIMAIAAVNRLTARGPYSLLMAQAILKVPVGALTALTGMLLLQSGIVGLGPVNTKAAYVAWAFIFGASQELVTRLVDQKAAEVTEKAKPEKATTVSC